MIRKLLRPTAAIQPMPVPVAIWSNRKTWP